MTLGPPPSAAGPSNDTSPATSRTDTPLAQSQAQQGTASTPGTAVSTGPYTAQFAVHPQPATRSYYGSAQLPAFSVAPQTTASHSSQNYSPQANYYPQPAPSAASPSTGYYGYPPNPWTNAWNTGTYQYPSGGGYQYPYATSRVAAESTATPQQNQTRKTPPPPPSPSPPPQFHKDWDAVVKSFLSAIGFSQALKGFEADMVVLNPEWEQKEVPRALAGLVKELMGLGQEESGEGGTLPKRPLDERKLEHVHLASGIQPRSQSSITRDISRFLAQNRARNDASNRNEFLHSLADKRRRLNDDGDSVPAGDPPSCARTDAKAQNRDLQMKYDIAKNEDGPLRRTMKAAAPAQPESDPAQEANRKVLGFAQEYPRAERYPGLDERLQNIEKHLAVRYVPSPPRSLLDRLKFLEDHIIHLEKEYPPWAALHFNQPNRGWPPPPRATPIIVPSHLTSTQGATESQTAVQTRSSDVTEAIKSKGKMGRQTKSSLHRAVMEKLEVQKAMNDLASPS
ncbi:hypothetical protein C8Q76DRAFT_808284 [Earliella scabrosa]|nr:hypothetical protein C8Q76DRAFT_808284 [Earliella scabrosa]